MGKHGSIETFEIGKINGWQLTQYPMTILILLVLLFLAIVLLNFRRRRIFQIYLASFFFLLFWCFLYKFEWQFALETYLIGYYVCVVLVISLIVVLINGTRIKMKIL
jgi:hypothetical protein